MHINRTVGFADWPQTEVVGPTDHHPIETFHDCLRILPDGVSSGLVADRATDGVHSIRRIEGWPTGINEFYKKAIYCHSPTLVKRRWR